MKLATGVMPPSNVGRKPKPINEAEVQELYEVLSTVLPEEMEDEVTGDVKLFPQFVGPDFSDKPHVFTKDFQASADGRKFSKVLHKKLGKVVRVNVYHNGIVGTDGKPTEETRYTWRLYIPVSEYSQEELEGTEEDNEEIDTETVDTEEATETVE